MVLGIGVQDIDVLDLSEISRRNQVYLHTPHFIGWLLSHKIAVCIDFIKIAFAYFEAPGKWSLLIKKWSLL